MKDIKSIVRSISSVFPMRQYSYQFFNSLVNDTKDAKGIVSISKITDYLYDIIYDSLDYDYANELMRSNQLVQPTGCSSIRNGNFIGRNLDWTYDEACTFIIRTHNDGHRYATISVAGGIAQLTKKFVEEHYYNNLYRLLPIHIQDGINEHGLYCSLNVVPSDYGKCTSDDPDAICLTLLPRYILDYCKSVQEAIDFVNSHSFYTPKSLQDQGYELHFLIADSNTTKILEFVGGVPTFVDRNYITNFHVYDTPEGALKTPADVLNHEFPSSDGITIYGAGIERYNIIVNDYDTANTKNGMKSLLSKLNYTNTYKDSTNPFWYSEYVGILPTITVDTPPDNTDVQNVVEYVKNLYNNRTRDGVTWHTVHQSVYDLNQKKLYISVQESTDEYMVQLKDPYKE